jgi:hypothetical protein
MRQFEFHDYGDGTYSGTTLERANITTLEFEETSQAKAAAGRMARKLGGPVDLAKGGDGEWADRYITTAAKSEHHSAGYRFERLDG